MYPQSQSTTLRLLKQQKLFVDSTSKPVWAEGTVYFLLRFATSILPVFVSADRFLFVPVLLPF